MTTEDSKVAELSPMASFFISILFWLSLGSAACLYAVLALSPRLSESLKLRDQYVENAIQSSALQQEIKHLSRVADALKHDPEFVARVAGRELVAVPEGGTQIHVDTNLDYDARIPNIEVQQAPPAPWYASRVHQLSQPTLLRQRWLTATLTLFGLAFVCFNDGFFSNRLGASLLKICRNVLNRYQTDTA